MTQARTGDTVQIHYNGSLSDGTPFDSSAGRDPIEFAVGAGQVIPGFDKAVEGMAVGESKTVRIPPEDAYGPHLDQLVQEVPNTALPDDLTPEVGMQLQGTSGSGQTMQFVVTDVGDGTITLDGNHPLAGRELDFEIELVAIV